MRFTHTLAALLPLTALTAAAVLALPAGAAPLISGTGPAVASKAAEVATQSKKKDTVVLYSTITSNVDMYQPNIGPGVSGGLSTDPLQYFAVPFTPAANVSLTKMVLPIALSTGNRTGLTVGVYADAGGLPGELLFSWTDLTPFDWTVSRNQAYPCCSYVQVTAGEPIALNAGTLYWVAATSTPESDLSAVWLYNASGATGPAAYYTQASGAWQAAPANTLPALTVYGVAR